MAALHGGARAGAGRKPKAHQDHADDMAAVIYADPLAYLTAVANGTEKGDPLRVAAAKAALPYTSPKARAPVKSPAPEALRRKAEQKVVAQENQDWKAKAEAIRKAHKKG